MCCCCHYALNRTLLEVQIHQEPEVEIHQIRQESRFDIEETARNAKNFKGRTDREDIYTKLFNSWNQWSVQNQCVFKFLQFFLREIKPEICSKTVGRTIVSRIYTIVINYEWKNVSYKRKLLLSSHATYISSFFRYRD